MTKIAVYNVTDIDREQMSNNLSSLEVDFYSQSLDETNIDPDAEIISVFVNSKLSNDLIAQMPKLKLIATRSTGYDHIDLDYAKAKNISVANVPKYGENTVAEYAFALLFNLSRKMNSSISATKKGIYRARDFVGFDLKGKKIGIVGLGHIGRHSADIAYGLDMEILAYDIHRDVEFAKKRDIEYVSLDELLARSDIITLHTPLLESTRYMINDQAVDKMKDGVVIINTSRGEIIDNKALIRGLRSGKIGGAGLDTIEGERFLDREYLVDSLLDDESYDSYRHAAEARVLQHMPNVIVTEHCAYDTYEAIARINQTTADNINSFLEGRPINLV